MGLFTPNIDKLERNKKFTDLVKCLDHSKATVRYSAFVALAGKPDLTEETKAKLKDMMYNDPDPWVKTIATLKFAKLGDPSISDNLIQIIKEGSQSSKLQLLRLITESGASTDVTVCQIIIIALADKKILVRLQAVSAANASKNKLLIPYLGEILHENHHKIRLLAAKALYNIGRDESVDYLIELLSDKNTDVHSAVRTYLSAINNDRSYIYTDDIQSHGEADGNEPLHRSTTGRLGKKQVEKGLSILHNACGDKFRGVRIEALKSIAIFRHPSSIEIVENLLHDKFPEVRIEALNTLERIGGPLALDAIEKMEGDKKKIVREALERTLARMRKTIE